MHSLQRSQSYFYRAEALKGILLETTANHDDHDLREGYSLSVRDIMINYISCYQTHPNFDAFYNAVIFGHKHGEISLSLVFVRCRKS